MYAPLGSGCKVGGYRGDGKKKEACWGPPTNPGRARLNAGENCEKKGLSGAGHSGWRLSIKNNN